MDHNQMEQKIAELYEKAYALQKEIDQLEHRYTETRINDRDRKWPMDGDIVFYISDAGNICETEYVAEYDRNMKSIGNVFRTREDAQRAINWLEVTAEMRTIAYKYGDVSSDAEWAIGYDQRNDRVVSVLRYDREGGVFTPVFGCNAVAEACISEIGEARLKKCYFGLD